MSFPVADKKTKTIVVKTSDDQTVEIDEVIALQFETLKEIINNANGEFPESVIPLPNVTSKILPKVILFCQRRAATVATGGDSSDYAFYPELTEELKGDQETLFDLIQVSSPLFFSLVKINFMSF